MPQRMRSGRSSASAGRIEFVHCRGLRREDAARYVGVSATKFDDLVKDGRMPKPFRIDGCVLWDIRELDAALDALRDGDTNPWEDVE
jgi:predicted DNA-binding transcriptional regulator AlpA